MKFFSCFRSENVEADAPSPVLGLPAFTYQSIPTGADIRVFTLFPSQRNDHIVGELSNVALTSFRNNYVALSYCWGRQDASVGITCNSRAFNITPVLESALQSIRSMAKQPVHLWIDQICINQSNNAEKDGQVRLMSAIYRNAARVLIWLGPQDMYTLEAIKMTKRLMPACGWLADHEKLYGATDGVPASPLIRISTEQLRPKRLPRRTSKGWQALKYLLSRPWFSRAWVVQEAAVATEAVFFWGPYWLPWINMVYLVQVVRDVLPTTIFGVPNDTLLANIVLDIERVRNALQKGKAADPANLAVRYRNLGATDPRDKIYAFLSLSRNPGTFVNIYSVTPEELFVSVAYAALEYTNRHRMELAAFDETELHPVPFVVQGPPQRMMAFLSSAGLANHTGKYALPSWVPDWSFSEFPPFIWPNFATRRMTRVVQNIPSYDISVMSTSGIRSFFNENLSRLNWERSPLDKASTMTTNSVPTRLVLEGTRYTTIAAIASNCDFISDNHQGDEEKWFLSADLLAFPRSEPAFIPPSMEQHERFVETLCMGKSPSTGLHDLKPLPKQLKFVERRSFQEQMFHKLNVAEYWAALPNAHYREFYSTSSGYWGLGPKGTTVGDQIWCFAGLEGPFVLRPDGGEYLLIGECFVESRYIMYEIAQRFGSAGRPVRKQDQLVVQKIVLK